ncbi:hypothetical protein JCGZ_09050 [Jatropha curcas]|uniref:Integral membrane bound transporter domain-containing protein n=1 Tax=Jatropha curcas TaxID=180498 RepID=A0A067KHK2_JATCU|nr:uncharacterized protein LOC105636371 [Jatropha curcas]KDP35612.1 hypothetical protein JCGZ_09050 [Jatropha curcas]
MSATKASDPRKALWLMRLSSALRTLLACTIVGCTTLYGPAPLRHFLSYPSISYVTTILIVSDSTLGDTLRGSFHALYASIQAIIPSMLILWVIGPARFTVALAAASVAITSLAVAFPASTPLMAKRIAFAQIVTVYVGAVIYGTRTEGVMHPLHVASSTALGALASVLALLLPYPRLAYCEVNKTCRLYVENASKRINLFMEAFNAQDNQTARHFISQAELLSETGIKHLQTIKNAQRGIIWEKPQINFSKPNCIDPVQVLQQLEIPIKGMEIALTSRSAFPVSVINEGLTEVLLSMKGKIGLKLEQAKCFAPFDATTEPETTGEFSDNPLWSRTTIAANHEELPDFFFLYCMELLQWDSHISRSPECTVRNKQKVEINNGKDQVIKGILQRIWKGTGMILSRERWMFAVKCSLSLGFAVLFGLIFDKENAYWSGLTIAITFAEGREPTFTLANARAQGTAMGSVYGILCSFIFRRSLDLRFLLLLPWIIFTSFLRHSRMYGQAGGISAVTGAMLILGRQNYGSPSQFAIARITEACIGLICFITIEILLQPARAATLAKTELVCSLRAIRDCIEDIALLSDKRSISSSLPLDLREKQKTLDSRINQMEKFIVEAALEPNFWFLPFHDVCYDKVLRSLRKMQDLWLFSAYNTEIFSEISEKLGLDWEELAEHIEYDLDHFQRKICPSLRCLEELISIKSMAALENERQKKSMTHDIELGKSTKINVSTNQSLEEFAVPEIVNSFLENSREIARKVNASKGEQKLKSWMILCLNGLGFCIKNLLRETIEIEKEIDKLIAWENPTRHINFA